MLPYKGSSQGLTEKDNFEKKTWNVSPNMVFYGKQKLYGFFFMALQ